MLCEELAAIWTERWPRPDPETNRHNARMVKGFARAFAGIEIAAIDYADARAWALANPGKARYVRAMLNDALDDKLLGAHPFANMQLPRPREAAIVPPTTAEIYRLSSAAPDALASMIVFAAFTGIRQAEQRALTAADLEATIAGHSRARIDWQLTRDGRLKHPKMNRRRRILIPEPARVPLEQLLAEGWEEGRPERLWPLSRDQLNRLWGPTREAAGVDVRWHDLRHHAATWFLDHGATAEDVAKQLGCDVDLVRRRYGHPDPEKVLGRLERLVDA